MEIKVLLTNEEVCKLVGTSLVPHLGLCPENYDTKLELVGYPSQFQATFTKRPETATDPDLPSV